MTGHCSPLIVYCSGGKQKTYTFKYYMNVEALGVYLDDSNPEQHTYENIIIFFGFFPKTVIKL